MRVGCGSHVGRVRKVNEDAFFCDDRLLVVADGMGGHVAGEVASRAALDTVRAWRFPDRLLPDAPLEEIVERAILAANQEVYDRAVGDARLRGMGTTLTLAYILGERSVIGHVGDSRAYLWRDGRLTQLTHDHSVVAELVRSGGLSAGDARSHPYRNLLTRALGTAREVDVDVERVRLQQGDGLLLCTDGLTGVVADDEIVEIIAGSNDPQEAVDRMIDLANARGGPDNITAIFALREEGESE